MRINSPEELKSMQEFYSQALNAQKKRILVCAGTGCVAGGSLQIYARLKELMEEWGIPCESFSRMRRTVTYIRNRLRETLLWDRKTCPAFPSA